MIGYIIFFLSLVLIFCAILYVSTHLFKTAKSTKSQRPYDLENQQVWPGYGQGQVQQPVRQPTQQPVQQSAQQLAHPASAYAQGAVYA